jgi:hypothetical protein
MMLILTKILEPTQCLKFSDPGTSNRTPVSFIAKEIYMLKPEGRRIQLVYASRKG